VELVGEQKLLTSAGRQLENEVEIKFSASIEQARERMEDLQKEIEDTRQEISALEVEFRSVCFYDFSWRFFSSLLSSQFQ